MRGIANADEKANAHYKKYGTVKGCEGISDEKAENLDIPPVEDVIIMHNDEICKIIL